MSHVVRFGSRISYAAARTGITLPVDLRLRERRVLATAKLNTGASHSVFRREVGEELGLTVAAGAHLTIETVTGDSRPLVIR